MNLLVATLLSLGLLFSPASVSITDQTIAEEQSYILEDVDGNSFDLLEISDKYAIALVFYRGFD